VPVCIFVEYNGTKGKLSFDHHVEPVKVMLQLSGCNEYGVDQFLNLSVHSFGLVEHLTDEIDWALNTISMAGLFALDHEDSGDDSISHGNVELKDFS
jgi:hypothetical protein